MTGKQAHNLVQIPLYLVALGSIGLGLSWLMTAEPWLLDQQANEALLGTSFQQLFQTTSGIHLDDYLRLSYRFFGWWLVSIGFLMGVYLQVTRMGTILARRSFYLVLLLILLGIYRIESMYIAGSPFVYLTHGLTLLVLISMYGSYRLKRLS
ncbi:MAG: hypothetical protein D6762_03650 [Candidatus Neomarinimicrobiota bacterium]|nr:MAG: hypothetical protein D6762_03650 [Candidatus Neomarinimicrobiota bacterium]